MMPLRLFLAVFSCSLLLCVRASSDCVQRPCNNGGRCVTAADGNRVCQCPSAWIGDRCDFRNPCDGNLDPCQNGGTCEPKFNADSGAIEFACRCPIGFSASLCEVRVPTACDAATSLCNNGATCRPLPDEKYECVCPLGFRGPSCSERDPCAPNPCANEAACSVSGEDNFACACKPGFTGRLCNVDINECADDPCVRGTCVNLRASFECQCPEGYTGKRCNQPFVPCSPSPCENGGRCEVTGQFEYVCKCREGFTDPHCSTNIDDCTHHQCQNGGTCLDGVLSYSCQCPSEYKGTLCELDVDECREWPGAPPCFNGGTCRNTVGGYKCICVNGWEGDRCERNQDDCANTVCYNGGTCHDRVASFHCECPPGKTGLLCHLDDACISSPCKNGAVCSTNRATGGFVCDCPKGFRGVDCAEDVDECLLGNPCEHGGTCVNTPGAYRCDCARGWTGPWCEQNVNECASNPCLNEASCIDDVGRFKCLCMPGFSGERCEHQTSACTHLQSNPCQNGGRCVQPVTKLFQRGSGAPSYLCVCPRGFGGVNCERRTTGCGHSSCLNGGTCTDQRDGFKCTCPPGYGGERCSQFVDACSSNPCQHGGQCTNVFAVNTAPSFLCACPKGYTGALCDRNVNSCAPDNPCANDGTCVDLPDGFKCYCKVPFAGDRCEHAVDPCRGHRCRNGAVCVPSADYTSFTCQCPDGFRGTFCQSDIDECLEFSPCRRGHCVNTPGSYKCQCERGFAGKHCDINVDDCASQPCLNNGGCIDLVDGFRCECPAGFGGPTCGTNADECASSPCRNGATCVDRINRFSCLCPVGFSGPLCEKNDDDCGPNSCLNGGTCVDLANDFRCRCPPNYTGRHCHERLDLSRFEPLDQLERAVCRRHNCSGKADNGVCNAECNYFACGYDGSDCSAGWWACLECEGQPSPWANCTAPSYCARVYDNGECDPVCNTENCLFDGFDCYPGRKTCGNELKGIDERFCVQRFGDGVCDEQCDSAACGFDGGDCQTSSRSPDVLAGDVVLVLLVEPSEFVRAETKFLMAVSKLVHATVKVKVDGNGDRMIYRWSEDGQSSLYESAARRSRRSLTDGGIYSGTLVVLTVDVSECTRDAHSSPPVSDNTDCFSSVVRVAAYLGAAATKQALEQELGWPVYSARGELPSPDEAHSSGFWHYIVLSLLVALIVSVAAILVVSRKRKIRAPVWFPDGFQGKDESHKRACFDAESRLQNGYGNYYDDVKHSMGSGMHPLDACSLYNSSTVCDRVTPDAAQQPPTYGTLQSNKRAPINPSLAQQLQPTDWAPVHYAVADGTLDKLASDADCKGPDGVTPLHLAAMIGRTEEEEEARIAENVINAVGGIAEVEHCRTESYQEPALITAVRLGRHMVASTMLSRGADRNVTDKQGNGPLHHAVLTNDHRMVQLLLDGGAPDRQLVEVDAQNDEGATPLLLCARAGFVDATRISTLLLDGGATPSTGDSDGRTPLHWAATHGLHELVVLLVQRGANKDAQDQKDETAMMLAAGEGNVDAVMKLLSLGASKDITDQLERQARDIAQQRHHLDVVALLDRAHTVAPMHLPQQHSLTAHKEVPMPASVHHAKGDKRDDGTLPGRPKVRAGRKRQQQQNSAAKQTPTSGRKASPWGTCTPPSSSSDPQSVTPPSMSSEPQSVTPPAPVAASPLAAAAPGTSMNLQHGGYYSPPNSDSPQSTAGPAGLGHPALGHMEHAAAAAYYNSLSAKRQQPQTSANGSLAQSSCMLSPYSHTSNSVSGMSPPHVNAQNMHKSPTPPAGAPCAYSQGTPMDTPSGPSYHPSIAYDSPPQAALHQQHLQHANGYMEMYQGGGAPQHWAPRGQFAVDANGYTRMGLAGNTELGYPQHEGYAAQQPLNGYDWCAYAR